MIETPSCLSMTGKRRVLLCCNTSFGLANFRAGLIQSLQSEGYHVIAVAPRDIHTPALQALNVEFFEWKLSARSANVFNELRSLLDLRRIYKEARPDLCLHYTVKPVIYGAIVCSHLNLAFASVITGLGYAFLNDGWLPRLICWLYARVLSKSARTWFLNRDDRDLFLRKGLVQAEVAAIMPGEGIDTSYFAPSTEPRACGPVRFLMVSRLLYDKGVAEFADACRHLKARGVQYEASLVGATGSENPTAIPATQVEQWVRSGLFQYLGTVIDVRPLLAASDCVVLPSYREGLPRALMEASSMELPVVATDVPGCRDVVRDMRSGLLCRVKDASALADAMARVCSMSVDERLKMGRAGRTIMQEAFEVTLVNRTYLDFIKGRLQS